MGLNPIQPARRIRQFSHSAIEDALRPPDAPKVEAKRGKPLFYENLIDRIDDFVVHRPAMLRVEVQDQGDGRPRFFGVMVSAFQATFRTIENDIGHLRSLGKLEAYRLIVDIKNRVFRKKMVLCGENS